MAKHLVKYGSSSTILVVEGQDHITMLLEVLQERKHVWATCCIVSRVVNDCCDLRQYHRTAFRKYKGPHKTVCIAISDRADALVVCGQGLSAELLVDVCEAQEGASLSVRKSHLTSLKGGLSQIIL